MRIYSTGKIFAFLLVAMSGCFSNRCMAQRIDKGCDISTIRKNNKFCLEPKEFSDTIYMLDPITNQQFVTDIVIPRRPFAMNGKIIYDNSEVDSPAKNLSGKSSLEQYFFSALKDNSSLKKLPDGLLRVYIYNVIINEAGKVVFYDLADIRYKGSDGITRYVNVDSIAPAADSIFTHAPQMIPAKVNGNNVIIRLNKFGDNYSLYVKKHNIITYIRKD